VKYFVAPNEDRRLDATARTTLRGNYIRLSDGITHYELTGPEGGDVVVLAGGLTVPLFYWDATAAALHLRGLRTLAYSGYGRGYSDRIRGRYDEALFVRQLGEVIDHLDLPRPRHLVGASMGAMVAMAYTGQHADTTATLTLIGPAGLTRQPRIQKILLGNDWSIGVIAKHLGRRIFQRHQAHNVSDPHLAADLADMVDEAYRYEGSLFAFFSTLAHFPPFERAELYRQTATLPVPIMLMWGTDDQVTPIGCLDQVRRLLKPQQCHVVEDCGHMIPFERPAVVAERLASFVASIQTGNQP
jgi:pimeloyl-ACP methyl ester carboxylesterase